MNGYDDLGIDVHDAVNGVSLPKQFHLSLPDQYYLNVNALAKNWHSKEDAIQGLASIAEDLLRQSGKLK